MYNNLIQQKNVDIKSNNISSEINILKSFINQYSSFDLSDSCKINESEDVELKSIGEESEDKECILLKSVRSESIDINDIKNVELELKIEKYVDEICKLCENDDINDLPPIMTLNPLKAVDDADLLINENEKVESSPLVMLIKSLLPISKENGSNNNGSKILELNNIGILQKEVNNLKMRMNELLLSHKSQLSGLESEIEIQNRVINHYHNKSENNEYINNLEREILQLKPENAYLKMNLKIISNEMNDWKNKYLKLFNNVLNNSYYFTPCLLRNEINKMIEKGKEELLLSLKSKLESNEKNKNEIKILKEEIDKENKIKKRLNDLENEYKSDIIKLRRYLLEMQENDNILKELSILRSKLKESKEIILEQKENNEIRELKNEKEIRWLRKEIERLRNKK